MPPDVVEPTRERHLVGPFLQPLEDVQLVASDDTCTRYVARHASSGRQVSVRVYQASDPIVKVRAENEMSCLARFGGGDVIKLVSAGSRSRKIEPKIPLEMGIIVQGGTGTIADLLPHAGKVPRSAKLSLLMELLRALRKLERQGFVHRNVNPETVAFVGRCEALGACHAKLDGFGLACKLRDIPRRQDSHASGKNESGFLRGVDISELDLGTAVRLAFDAFIGAPPVPSLRQLVARRRAPAEVNAQYAAPEVWSDGADLSKMDVWSAGMLALEMFAGAPGVSTRGAAAAGADIHPNRLDLDGDDRFRRLQAQDPEVAKLIAGMLEEKTWRRWSVRRALNEATRLARLAGVDTTQASVDYPFE